MKAAVIHGPGSIKFDTVDDPKLQNDRDVILKVTSTAICGSDLHIYSGEYRNQEIWYLVTNLWALLRKWAKV
ncbi:alcohol dehydrogenase catalytic domain-containing protein [Niabella ginsengisoli]|uniref:Alcohol dehydrogenase catalytic domain-containing protein n=1 Tax=Niabella ginsengisoli TaxID=522298 RepID=A0ABS9SKE9_9BACT|nr:alcohol dehydrogenase catalytic domain-containing protein [Niabella ginsengisoli]MCH5598858.1 alcohol dehydrogenase catalytic domain-containing protein [Niabella ginsengisoli]